MTRSIVIADVAEAIGLPQRVVLEEINRAAIADAVLLIVLARFWPHVPVEKVGDAAGVSKTDLSAAIGRYHEHHHRAAVATSVAVKAGTRQRHVPVGDPPSAEHRWCKKSSHWVHQDDMSRNRSRADGYGDWCKPCWRAYWQSKVARERAARPIVASAAPTSAAPARVRKPRATGPSCVECKAPMRDVNGRPRCLAEGCSIGDRNRRTARRTTRRGTAALR